MSQCQCGQRDHIQTSLTCRASWSSTQHQPLCLSESDVASVRQWCDTQTATVPDILVGVLDLSITDVDLGLLALFVLVVAQLTLPLEAGLVLNALFNQSLNHISGMHINGTEGDELLAVILGELSIDDGD